MKKVSVIITTHNRCELLKNAIDSVLNQTYKNIECIVVDDASTDSTELCVKEYVKKGVKYIKIPYEESKGGNYARNVGLNVSTGKYIAYLDDDDEFLKQKIELQESYMEKNKEIGWVTCGRIINKNNGKYCFFEERIINDKSDYSRNIFSHMVGTTSLFMFKKDFLNKIGAFDENVKYLQDYELSIRAAQESKIGVIQDCLVVYRDNKKDKNRLSNNIDNWYNSMKYIEKKHEKLIENLSTEEKKQHKLLIYREFVYRCKKQNDRKGIRYYHYKMYKLTGEKKYLIKSIFCIVENPLIKMKRVLKWTFTNEIQNIFKENYGKNNANI